VFSGAANGRIPVWGDGERKIGRMRGMKSRVAKTALAPSSLIVLGAALALGLSASSRPAVPSTPARFELPHDDVLIDESIPIMVSGLTPGANVTVRLRGGADESWAADATFTADRDGRIDLTRIAPLRGSYKDIDPMGLFWSADRTEATDVAAASDEAEESSSSSASPERWTLTAAIGETVVARATVRRRAVAADVRVRVDGLVGVFYEPPGSGRHPAVLVLGGSGGGIPPAAGPAGGLASRGYAVLALAYFGVGGLPPALSNIPLEYFGRALRWLAAQPSVEAGRIGVLGASRGAELALLLGSVYPDIHAVIAYMPSNIVRRGCCDPSTLVAWTAGGHAIAAMPPPGIPLTGRLMHLGGTPGTAKAREDSWREMLAFVDRHLRALTAGAP
jgi:hypothetical protein